MGWPTTLLAVLCGYALGLPFAAMLYNWITKGDDDDS